MAPTVTLSPVQVLALAAVGVFAGEWIKRRVRIFQRLSIPGSIIGGLLYALIALLLHGRIANLQPDTVLRDVLMLAVFTIIGLSASVRVIVRGGALVVLLLAIATAGAVLQNLLGIGLARILGVHALTGILAGSVALAGGPATALAFGPTFERMGVPGATTVALASATFGITVSGLLAGSIGGALIRRYRLQPSAERDAPEKVVGARRPSSIATHVLVIAIAMGAGSIVTAATERAGIVLPQYIGAMIVAAILRNVDDRWNCCRLSESQLASLFNVALPLFIVMAMLALRLWELAALAGPVLAILSVQTVLACLVSALVVFPLMRRDFDAAVISTGYCGFMLGITANALATMDELTNRYGPSPRAFIVVPIVGAFLIDFTNALVITLMANLLR